ncbi:ADP-heptose synthase [Cohnella nanjingensis]|uniref:ADP-heptose synthase n=1 Tax=Cohnella nanjingensis TaxID=1387779 RepID=A0A7X0RL07_9BACL|nr:ADP-heptose synthase [Cohnella nanjingensis]MBB6669223.1 ADP-heptose synthase [Cohnella nanjingensis]
MNRRFVIEAVMIAIYGQLLLPKRPVEYRIPYSTIMELYDMKDSPEPVMPDPDDDRHVKGKIGEMIAYFEDPFNKKKLERALMAPWKESPPLPINDRVTMIVVNAVENMQYGEMLDPIETELVLASLRLQCPVLTDHIEFQDKVVQNSIPVQVFDIDDYEFAVEEDVPASDEHSQ